MGKLAKKRRKMWFRNGEKIIGKNGGKWGKFGKKCEKKGKKIEEKMVKKAKKMKKKW